jgi:cytochrome c oxidase subunit 3
MDIEIPYTIKARPDTGLYNGKLGMWMFLASEVMFFGGLFSAYILLRINALEGAWPYQVLDIKLGLVNTFILIASSVTIVLAWAAAKLRKPGHFRMWMGITILLSVVFLGIKATEYSAKFHHFGVFLKDGREITGHLEKGAEGDDFYLLVPDAPFGNVHNAKLKRERYNEKAAHAPAEGEAHSEHSAAHEPVLVAHLDQAGLEAAAAAHRPVEIPKSEVKRANFFKPAYNTYYAIYFTLTGMHALHILGGIVVMLYFWGPGFSLYKRAPEQFSNRIEVTGLFWHFVDIVWIFVFPTLYLL